MSSSHAELIKRSTSPDDTFDIGVALGRALCGGVSIGLVGPLGAGKTHLVKGIAAGNTRDARTEVTSPTFTLVNEYPGRLHLFHVDAYRLNGPRDFIALGVEEFIRDDSALVVEWADRVRPAMSDDCLWIDISPDGMLSRVLSLQPRGELAVACLAGAVGTLG